MRSFCNAHACMATGIDSLTPRLLGLVFHFHVLFLFDGDRARDQYNNYVDSGNDRYLLLHPSLCILRLVCTGWHALVHRIRQSLRTHFDRTVLNRRKNIVWDALTRRLAARKQTHVAIAASSDKILFDIYSKAKRLDMVVDEGMMTRAHEGMHLFDVQLRCI